MQRFFIGCLALLGSLGFVSSARADTSVLPAGNRTVAPQSRPVYLAYMPFSCETFVPVPQELFAGELRNALRVGLDKTRPGGMQSGILRLTSPADIQTLRMLLKDPHHLVQAQGFCNTRFMLDADGGETQIFVDTEGMVSSGSHSWRLTPGDFGRLKQVLERICAAPPSPR